MTAPIAVCDVAAAAGLLLVLGTVISVVTTVIVPRKSGSRLTRLVASAVNGVFGLIVRPVASYRWRDRIMAGQAAVILLGQLAVWLGAFYVGYALLIWPTTHSIGTAFRSVGPALWTFGSPDTHGFFETAVLDTAAMAGLVTITLQIAYLPALYAAFNRRENEIALLNSRPAHRRGGQNCWPEPTMRSAPAPRRWTPCPSSTATGNAGLRTSPRAMSRTCRWFGSAHPATKPPGRRRCWPCSTLPRCISRCVPRRLPPFRPGCACAVGCCASPKWPAPWASRCHRNPPRPPASASRTPNFSALSTGFGR